MADPLQVDYDLEYFASELEQWRFECDEDGEQCVGPFVISFSADHLHKADISGGPPYAVDASRPLVDPVVLYERHCLRFLPYVLTSLAYGGFIGFDQFAGEKHPLFQKSWQGSTSSARCQGPLMAVLRARLEHKRVTAKHRIAAARRICGNMTATDPYQPVAKPM